MTDTIDRAQSTETLISLKFPSARNRDTLCKIYTLMEEYAGLTSERILAISNMAPATFYRGVAALKREGLVTKDNRPAPKEIKQQYKLPSILSSGTLMGNKFGYTTPYAHLASYLANFHKESYIPQYDLTVAQISEALNTRTSEEQKQYMLCVLQEACAFIAVAGLDFTGWKTLDKVTPPTLQELADIINDTRLSVEKC